MELASLKQRIPNPRASPKYSLHTARKPHKRSSIAKAQHPPNYQVVKQSAQAQVHEFFSELQLTKHLHMKQLLIEQQINPRPRQPSQHQRSGKSPGYRARKRHMVVVCGEKLGWTFRRYAVDENVMDGLHVERFLDFGVGCDE
jgi:hypothetical protein